MGRAPRLGETATALIGTILLGVGFLLLVLRGGLAGAETILRTPHADEGLFAVLVVGWVAAFSLPFLRFRILLGGGVLCAAGLLLLIPEEPTPLRGPSWLIVAARLVGLAAMLSSIGLLILGDLFASKRLPAALPADRGRALLVLGVVSMTAGAILTIHGLLSGRFYGGGGPPPPPGSGLPWPPPDYTGLETVVGRMTGLIALVGWAVVGGVTILRHRALFGVGLLGGLGVFLLSMVMAGSDLADAPTFGGAAVETGIGLLVTAFGAGAVTEVALRRPEALRCVTLRLQNATVIVGRGPARKL